MFTETQSFTGKFVGVYLWFVALIIFLFLVFPEWSMMSIPFLVIVFGGVSLLYFAELHTHVNSEGVHIRFFPFHLSERLIEWDEIEKFEAEQYKPLLEFGGWGIRWRPKKIAYNVKGNEGVRITKKNGKQVLIGSEKPRRLEEEIRDNMG